MTTIHTTQTNESFKLSSVSRPWPPAVQNDVPIAVTVPENRPSTPCFNIQRKKFSLNESESLKEARVRSLSHWPHSVPSKEDMICAGWFSCNITDRVICIYCDKLCHQWAINDDPREVHRRLSPNCPFVRGMISSKISSPEIVNSKTNEKIQPKHANMTEISQREASFSNGTSPESLPTVESLVRAGFFLSRESNTITCFYCNGSLKNWNSNIDPMIEHARWFPNCIYAKHLCGDELFEKIQRRKSHSVKENPIDEKELHRIVVSRLDLPIAEKLRSQYSAAIVKRCLEDQFRVKNDDFKTDTDFATACQIVQKQLEIVKGSMDNIIIPSKGMESDISTSFTKISLGDCCICLTEEKKLACMPCGHLCACVPCGYSLKSCPMCRQRIESFVRISN